MIETLGNRIQRYRKARKMTQEELAFKLNITSQAVSKWETDSSYPNLDLLCKLAEIFNCSLDELMGRVKEETKVVPEAERKDINQMLLRIRILSKEEKAKVNVNLPVSLIMACYEAGKQIPVVEEKLKGVNIDLEQIVSLISSGVVGNIVEIETDDGNLVNIFVE